MHITTGNMIGADPDKASAFRRPIEQLPSSMGHPSRAAKHGHQISEQTLRGGPKAVLTP